MHRPLQAPTETEVAARRAVLLDFIQNKWALMVPKAVPPFDDEDKIKSEKNFQALAAALNQYTVIGKGNRPVRADVLADIVAALDKGGYLEHYPEVVEKIVEVERKVPLNRKEALKASTDLTRLMNAKDLSPIQGFSSGGEKDKESQPRASREQLEAQAAKDLSDNETMGDVRALIQAHSHSGSHAATKYEREILTSTMNDGIQKGLEPKDIKANVQAEHDAMANWGPQDALKRLRPELFQTKKEQW